MADPATKAMTANTTAFLRDELRRQFPYMKTQAMEDTVQDAIASITANIQRHEPAMKATKARTSFFSLPAELRNTIYEMALLPYGDDDRYYNTVIASSYQLRCRRRLPSLLYASHKTRAEAGSIYFAGRVFEVTLHASSRLACGEARKWLRMIGAEHVSKMKRFVIRFREFGPEQIERDVRSRLPSLPPRSRYHPNQRDQSPRKLEIRKRDILSAHGLDVLGVQASALIVRWELDELRTLELDE